ncbi:MAG: HdeD family acid-resistance protein [Planctomycetaceae bacterium]|nr:HdeD family acid-resistance protein [Planctomycetaceae bacterium]
MDNDQEKTTPECKTEVCCQKTNECRCGGGCFRFGNFLIGILFIAAALTAFRNPVGNLFAVAMIFGIMAILSGLWSISHFRDCKLRFVTGLIEIAAGVLLLVHLEFVAKIIPYIFAVWFVCNSITNLTLLSYARNYGCGHWWFLLLMGILGIAIGIALFFNPVIAMLTLAFLVGFYLMIVGIIHIILAFSHPHSHEMKNPEEKSA